MPDARYRASRRGRGGARAGVAIADQLLYSFTNFVLTVLVARSVSASGFGAFALAMATYLLMLSALRGLTSEALVVRFSAAEPALWRRGATSAYGAAASLGVIAGVGTVLAGLAFDGTLRSTLLALGICLPGLAVQDYLRYAALAVGRPSLALANDATQAAVQFGLIGAVLVLGHAQVWALLAAWGLAAYLGAAVGSTTLRLVPRPGLALSWFKTNGDLAGRYAVDDLAATGSQQTASYVLAGVAGLSDAGALRGVQTVFGPPMILNLGVQAAVTPELIRILRRSSSRMRQYVIGLAIILGIVGVLWGALALAIPSSVGRALFGKTWTQTRTVIGYFVIVQAANSMRVGPQAGLRAFGAANRTLTARLIVSMALLVAQVAGALVDGIAGVAIATAIAAPLQALVWWWQFELARRDYQRDAAKRRVHDAWQKLVRTTAALSESN